MKTERVERCGRGCYVRECLCEVVEGRVKALEDWCETGVEHT